MKKQTKHDIEEALRAILVPGRSIEVAQWFARQALIELEREDGPITE